ncbi:putative telomere silencing protein Zds1 [Aspergillus nomiae NRRL 13137]|uniref:Putative telomere silencing protein Zds1 n=1 Tax=Aspergillus nomiae NRRL (strain ATCC 15546 / NRRL 13137 / CBS 260.88 / M93) TaxID=1509407 RepID=A0A0L1J2F7_ASPN3|nr:putative telomere silencing protein Zds1 [Aspergillus nomiae NRRL 13137]KNG85981.1 putative telomere silencing protein Zds1 [Aspergillus nomiae NRRL 13137]
MQATPSPSEAGGGYATRRGHASHLSISDPSHHVTEAIGHMYDDDYDKRNSQRLSYISSPLSESISIIPPNLAGAASPTSPQSIQLQNHLNAVNNHHPVNGQSRPPTDGATSLNRESSSPASPTSTTSPGSTDTATTSFPLNDIDYESDPAAVAQELNNLAAIRRMSMDVAATGDPDLPSFNSDFSVPPSPSADENDAARLFWVPARLHPELAPKEFKSFLESKTEQIKRRSGDFNSLGPERQGSTGGLRRKKSMLSRQIDNSHGYTDGAERLERKRSQSRRDPLTPNLQELETLVDNSKPRSTSPVTLLNEIQNLGITADEDRPILPPAPLGHSLRRSTRTQYRKAGSLKKGEKLPYSKRFAKASDVKEGASSTANSFGEQATSGLARVSTDPTPSITRNQASGIPAQSAASPSNETTSSALESVSDQLQSGNDRPSEPSMAESGGKTNTSSQTRQWHSRLSSNGRSTLNIPPTEQKIPEIIETPPPETSAAPTTPTSLSSATSGRGLTQDSPSSSLRPRRDQALPGNSTRTDSLSFIPTLSEERKPEPKKSKDKKESEGTRKSSWHWLLGSEEKDKDKDKEKKKDKESDAKKIKAKLVDKVHETANALPSSNDSGQRGRESLVLDRLDPKLEEERRKDHVRRTSGESKKEKESGLFSSLFGGGKKKSSTDSNHKKSSSRTLSPDPPPRELRPDVDYPWTRFTILEERAIYRMAHIKLANPRRALYSQVLLSNFMYSYLAKVQQMHPLMLASSASQRHQKTRDQQDDYSGYQQYQEAQMQHYSDSSYDDPQMYEYGDDSHDAYRQHTRGSKNGYENGHAYGPGHYQYGNSTFGDDVQLDDDDDDMW